MRRTPLKRGRGFAASPQQRAKVKDLPCICCGRDRYETIIDPAHLIDKSLCNDGDGDPRAVVPLCRETHRLYDNGSFSLLELLEPRYRTELAYAVERYGLLNSLIRITNSKWNPAT